MEKIEKELKEKNEREMEISEAGNGVSSSIQIHFQVKSAFYQRRKKRGRERESVGGRERKN